FDGNLDRSITKAEFVAGLKRIAAQLVSPPGGDLSYADLIKPLSAGSDDKGGGDSGAGFGTLQPRIGKSGGAPTLPTDGSRGPD
ncbi:MAG TPA: hypothetical protein VG942_18555, partial [Hyphomonadaceae bacterium]|nr:hypothetical protein [Hyphomonadaceae bacterium]